MPLHVDEWIVIVRSDAFLDSHKASFFETFTESRTDYPIGSHISFAVIQSITGVDFISLSSIVPGLFFIILGLLIYCLSNVLFNNNIASLVIMSFTPLALSNITILGPFYLVPISWGIMLSLLLFYFLVRKLYIISIFIFFILSATHSSSMVFVMSAIGVYFIFNRENWKLLKYFIIVVLLAIILFIFIVGFNTLSVILSNFFAFQKMKPYISFYLILPTLLIFLLAVGLYLIFVKEKKASQFLLPLFAVLAVNAFLYWNWQGFFIVYRKLFTYTFLMMPFFLGYAVYYLGMSFELFVSNWVGFIKKYHLLTILFVILLLPVTIGLNIDAHKDNHVYVDHNENKFFSEFGQRNPGTYLVTNHLQAFALPYYDLKPVQLSPAHGVKTLHFSNLVGCYSTRNPECFGDFFYRVNHTYLYTRFPINVTYLEQAYRYGNKVIYQYDRKDYWNYINNTYNITLPNTLNITIDY